MKKQYIISMVLILVVICFGVYKFYYTSSPENVGLIDKVENNIHDATYLIDDQSVTLKGGRSETPAAPNSSSKIITQYFGNEVVHDFDGDGRQDRAFLITQTTGGSGTFFYVVVVLNTVNGLVGSQGFLLGDRISPQTTEISDDTIIVNYADRNANESFATQPSVGKTARLNFDLKTMKLKAN